MEETNDFSGGAVDPRDIRPFLFVAPKARVREVVANGLAAMLLGDNVVNLERETMAGFGQLTILAAVVRSVAHFLFE